MSVRRSSRVSQPRELILLEEVERRHVLAVLGACNGNRTEAAKILGIDRKTLARRLSRWVVDERVSKN